jgi:hypothetical protein
LFFIFWDWLVSFSIWSILIAAGFSFNSWTWSAFIHETLIWLKKDNQYSKIMWRINWNTSLISMFFIIALPFLTQFEMVYPLLFWLWMDILWLIIVFTLVKPNNIYEIQHSNETLMSVIKKTSKIPGAIIYILFIWSIVWFMHSEHAYRNIYVEDLWLPIILIWSIMALSRWIWFIVSRFIHVIEDRYTMKQIMLFEIIIFFIWYIIIWLFNNPYIIVIIFAVLIWYQQWKETIMESYLLKNYSPNQRYKATLLSFSSQIWYFVKILFWILFWLMYTVNPSYAYIVFWIIVWTSLYLMYLWIFRKKS